MDGLTFLWKGIAIGFLAVIPPGAVALVCVQRTLSRRRLSGLVTGLGSATVDLVYAVAAVFFLEAVRGFLERYDGVLKVVGGAAVIVVGVILLLKDPVTQIRRNRTSRPNLWGDYASAAGISLANPAFILVYVMWFATFGIGGDVPRAGGVELAGGIFLGETAWWGVLALAVGFLRKSFRLRHLVYLNRISGTAIVLLGAAAILSIAVKFPR